MWKPFLSIDQLHGAEERPGYKPGCNVTWFPGKKKDPGSQM